MKNINTILFLLVGAAFFMACQSTGENQTGSEYMPDMAHSAAVESNVLSDYSLNTWEKESTISSREATKPRPPVKGTVPRGQAAYQYAGSASAVAQAQNVLNGQTEGSIAIPANGSVPYYYGDSEEERARATAELLENPFPITADGLERGKNLYNIFCAICHGEKGDGLGYLVSEENKNAKYPAAPANFLLDELVNSSNGRYYHSIMYGKNVMGAYKDKISYEERWQVIHWIRALQAKDKKMEYSAEANTLNQEYGVPASKIQAIAEAPEMMSEMEDVMLHEGEHHDEDHGGEH